MKREDSADNQYSSGNPRRTIDLLLTKQPMEFAIEVPRIRSIEKLRYNYYQFSVSNYKTGLIVDLDRGNLDRMSFRRTR